MATDRWESEWEQFGQDDPFFGVCNEPQYRGRDLSADSASAFWASGERTVADTLALAAKLVGSPVEPRRALDFGCGVGRLTAPLARRAGAVVGVDIAPTMLEHARQRCTECGLLNTSFARSDQKLTELEGTFDFIHSFIVFQHISPDVGYELLDTLLARLEPNGVGALHFTYARRASSMRKLVHRIRRRSRMVNMAVNLFQGVPFRFPMMPMYEYDLPRLVSAITATGVRDVLIRHTDHGGHIGALLVFQKPPVAHQ